MRVEIIILILGMGLVTYIPRALPAALIEKLKFGEKTEKFLKLIPYTAMAALVFPGVFTVDAAHPSVGIAGAGVAAVLAFLRLPVIVCVLGAVGVDMLLYTFIL